jgi:oxazoline/thiazoline dehydrogenase
MNSPLSGIILTFDRDVSLDSQKEQTIVASPQHKLIFKVPEPGLKRALFALARNGATVENMSEWIQEDRGEFGVLKFYQYLQKFTSFGWLCHTVVTKGCRIATARPMTIDARFLPTVAAIDSPRETLRERHYILSKFAYIHQVKGQMILESPLSKMSVHLSNWQAIAIVGLLANPCMASTIATYLKDIHLDTIEQLIGLLLSTQMLCEVAEDGTIAEQTDVVLAQWEFHDLLFHARSRSGRHANPVGGTYRFSGQIEQLPALSPHASAQTIALSKPDLANLIAADLPFAQVLENRTSIREHGEIPITAQQLGEFLYRCARIKDRIHTEQGELLTRPYPSGGAMYELELYLAIDRCQEIESGLYYYQPQAHELCSICGATAPVQALLRNAGMSMGADNPQLLIIITARFQRLAWKYESISYALMLKHVGALYQTMYLVATAMNLAPCGIGSGDSDLFTMAAGGNYYAQTSVGEFALGSRPEHDKPLLKSEL